MRVARLLSVLLIAFSLLLATLLSLLTVPQPGLAQSPAITMTKTLNRATNVVRVGEVLSFTITVTNSTSTFTLSNVTLFDDYDETVMAFAGAVPTHSLHLASNGTITWNNVATPVIPPGQSIRVTVSFTVEHAKAATVNYVEGKDIRDDMGASLTGTNTDKNQDAIGGNAPILKLLSPLTAIPQVGLPVTFTHIITNDGAALMTFLPLTDTYDSTFLQFHSAVPTPSIISPGQLVWTDLTTYFGAILPFETVVVTTVFTATTEVVNTVNRASIEGARDQYNNDLAGGLAQVPIIIIADSSDDTPQDDTTNDDKNNDDDDDDDDDSSNIIPQPTVETATATPGLDEASIAATATALAATSTAESQNVITDTQAAFYLPETGEGSPGDDFRGVFVISMALLLGLAYLFWRKKHTAA